MASHEISLIDQIGRMDGIWPKAQVRNRLCTRLLGVVYKITLSVVLGLLSNDLDGVLICAYGAIGTQPEEDRPNGVFTFNGESGIVIDAGVRNIVFDSYRKVIFGLVLGHIIIDTFDHCRSEFLR